MDIASTSYIGRKGYTILKSSLNEQEYKKIKTELYLKPVISGQNYGMVKSNPFPVYRENEKKIYVPRFYGLKEYGIPSKIDLPEGFDINIDFVKSLRDYQEKIIDVYLKHVTKDDYNKGGILEVPCGRGKTVLALKIISILKKKTLILVHKEFLMNQWIERIEEFLDPSTRVGKIQANVCDIEDKDIVIGMIQTMYNKEFPQEVYANFGLTIIDEVHRIGSEEFSRTLLKTISPYMLGISATVERKDKLTKLLYMFIGPKIYSEQRKNEEVVCVRSIEFKSNDPLFNEVEYDYRGQTKYSTMISKLCENGHRSDFIVRVIGDLLQENPDGQIMVLAHNKNLLKYIHDKIVHLQLDSVGYYIGGMKQKALQETETKKIVIATYAMAAEALDIKTLSRLVMATPKTDITQSVGRILRMKHENPVIVDIVDGHDCFQNQWKQRKRFYKKCNYRIRSIDSAKYTNMNIDWSSDKSWLWTFEPNQDVKEEKELPAKCLIDFSKLK
jgi:superfamily II DNA or RNA helicase